MKRMYEYCCPDCGSITSRLVEEDDRKTPQLCDNCGSLANYVVSAPHFDYRMGLDPVGNPTMGDKWARMHEEAGRKAKENETYE